MPAKRLKFHEKSDQSQETEVGKYPFSMLFDCDAEILRKQASDETIRTYLAILPYLREGSGHLLLTTAQLSDRTGLSTRQIGDCLRQLKLDKFDILQRDESGYYHPKIAAIFRKRARARGENLDQPSSNPSSVRKNDDSQSVNLHEGEQENDGSNRIIDREKKKMSVSESSSSTISNINITEQRSGDFGVAGAPQNPDLVPISIGSVLSVPGANFSKSVTKTLLANLKAKPEYESIKSRFEQVVFDCVEYWVSRGGEIQPGAIINSLNKAVGKTTKAKASAAPAEPKAPTSSKSNPNGFKGGVFIE